MNTWVIKTKKCKCIKDMPYFINEKFHSLKSRYISEYGIDSPMVFDLVKSRITIFLLELKDQGDIGEFWFNHGPCRNSWDNFSLTFELKNSQFSFYKMMLR